MTMTLRVLALLAALLAPPLTAQPLDFGRATTKAPDAPAVTVRATGSVPSVRPGDQAVIAVILEHAPHQHTNLNKPVVPPEMEGFVPIPTTIAVSEAAGLEFGRIQWPQPSVAKVDFLFTGNPIEYQVYSDTAVAYVPVRVADTAEPGERELTIEVAYQSCDDTTCQPPTADTVTVRFTVDPAAAAASPDATLFGGFNPSVFADPNAWGSGLNAAPAPKSKFLGVVALPDPRGAVGIAALAFFAAVGGFVLNLTPCVLPVIPIKVMTISRHAGESRARALKLGLWMAAGVVAFWSALGVLAVVASEFADPSRLFGFWWFTLSIGVLIAAMGVGIMGAFQIKLPQAVYAVNPKADSAWGSFLFGMMTAVLGLPCFGFVAGALLAGLATMPPAVGMVIFASMGAGMALPYLVLAAFPGMVKKLPRTGPASELVKQIMGLLMIAAAVYFIGSGLLAFLSDRGVSYRLPWWTKSVHWWGIALAMVAAGVWLLVRTVAITPKPGRRVFFGLVAVLFAFVGVGAAWNRTDHLRHNFWVDYSPTALADALDEGQIVVLDFTAEWCLNCKTLEATVLGRDPVRAELLRAGVVPMVADLTSNSAPGWDTLRDLGQTGIPLLVVFTPESGPDRPAWMANVYTPDQVLSALEAARSGLAASTVGLAD
jgi:thiol:disulfide interchange protein